MKYFDKILDKFSQRQRIIVLCLLLVTTVILSLIYTNKKDMECSTYKQELMSLHEDLTILSSHIRELRRESYVFEEARIMEMRSEDDTLKIKENNINTSELKHIQNMADELVNKTKK